MERVSFETDRGEAGGELTLPAGNAKVPGVVIIPEWWGVNDQIRSVAQRWADEGLAALVVDVFHGKTAANAAEAGALMSKLDHACAIADIAGAVAHLRAHARSSGKVAVTGYCMGGALAFAAAARVPGLAAVVPFYGLPPAQDWSKVDAPVQAHFASRDDWAKPAGAEEIKAALGKHGKAMELHIYEADHAFCNDRRPEVYDAGACATAWQRTVAFVKQHAGA